MGLIRGSWIGSGFCGWTSLTGLTSTGSVFIGSSIFVEGSNLMRGLFTGNVDNSLLSRDVMLLELLSLSGDLIVFS